MGQISEATALGWDPETKRNVVSKITKANLDLSPKIQMTSKSGGDQMKKTFGEAIEVITSQPQSTVDQAKKMATAELSAHESNYVEAEGQCAEGDPRLLAGKKVNIENVGKLFSGTYYITRAVHQYRSGEYSVRFSMSGSGPNTMYHLLRQDENRAENRVNGLVVGVVTNLEDPEQLGRVRVKFPWLPKYKDADLESVWARLATPNGGQERGIFFMPEIDDEVLVAFEHGDTNFPYIVGALWNKKDKPPQGTAQVLAGDKKKVDQRVICSRSGHLIVLNDKEGEEQIIIQDKTGKNSFLINSKDNSVLLKSAGDFTIQVGGKFSVTSTGDASVDTKGFGKFTSTSAVTVEGKTGVDVKGPAGNQLSVKAAGAELAGMKVDVKATTTAALNASAMLEIKGGVVKIN
jgi:uncharacterized protein involved in type VI secretion and phage assembly